MSWLAVGILWIVFIVGMLFFFRAVKDRDEAGRD